ncbi:E3 ubiquitin-protein ligase Praja-2 isoform X2 [Rissa tridactyla]|uniref:E3 ubiquitin-protein ligase Praja-2 isoform X2 n=2 Tax=Rissa tridactyla TaxID=75485 RepID=UPI0023BAD39E|nr:E3 ubiquitin-protein ligase Praja-2 isoform X2 [Rissa tridactyla]
MGQQGGKLAWPKPAEGYQSVTGRRYGRRHAYVSFRPSLNSQGRDEHQHEGCEQLEWEDVQQENSLHKSFCEDSSPSVQASSDLLDEPLLENIGTGEPICQSVSSQTFQANMLPFSLFCSGLEGNTISGNSMNPYENSEDLAEYASEGHNDLNGHNGIAFVNIDSYEPDSSDGEEDDAQDKFSLASEAEGVLQGTLDSMFSELEEGLETLTDLESRLLTLSHSYSRECREEAGPMPLMRYFSIDSGLTCPNNRAFESSAEDQAIPKSNLTGASCETQQVRNIVDVGIRTPIAIANELNASGGTTDQGNSPEQVVRPKIRKQSPANQLGREELLPSDNEEKSCSWRRNEVAEIQQGHVEYALRNSEEMSSSMHFDTREYQGHQKNTETVLRKNTAAQEQNMLDNSTVRDDFEDCHRHSSMSHDDEDRSEWSDGEWSTAVSSYFAGTDKDHSSSGETWETVPGREECEPEEQSSSSGIEEENTDVCFQGGEQILLEEGEIPWLLYREEEESSSDEEDDPVSDFVHPGLLLLDGNNNLEDDSSVSEDLEVEWRILDEFGDGLGLAQAIPYMDPQFITLMALEGRLQQAMESAVVHLESLGFDIEQAYPPATQETIDCLPQITVTDVHEGQEQCCTICCSEYVNDEIITELPCHHLFHKLCVTLWLEKSGTCPVCRHVLASMPPEVDAATVSFV